MLRKFIVVIAVVCSFTPFLRAPHLHAEEPIEEYLNELQERGYFDVALRYVDRMEKSDLAPSSFKSEADYRRGMLLVTSARLTKNPATKTENLSKAKKYLETFLSSQPQHPSSALARTQLGNILVERARGAMAKAKNDANNRAALTKQASGLYGEAYSSLVKSREELGKTWKSLAANREPAAAKQRSKIQEQYVQTYLAVARVLYEQAKTLKDDEKKYKAKLTEAAKAFEEVAQKYRKYSAGIYALLYEGECHQLMGDHSHALSLFKELLQNADDTPPIRQLKSQALAMSIDSWLASELTKGPDKSIATATSWLKTQRSGEERDPAWLRVQLALAKAYQKKSSIAKDDKASSRALKEAKELAAGIARKRGPVQAEAQTLLVSLGGNVRTKETAVVDGAGAADFTEARLAAKKLLDDMSSADTMTRLLSGQLDSISDPERLAGMKEKLAEAKIQSEESSTKALELYERADQLATSDDLDEQNGVRYFLSYLNYKKKHYRRAAVIAGFVATKYPESIAAKDCASVALAARQRLYQEASLEDRPSEADKIGILAELMATQWPGMPQADAAMMTLLDVIVSRGNIAEAEAYLEKIPAGSPKRASAELRIGQALWREYLKRLVASQSGESQSSDPELQQMKSRAKEILANGIERLGTASPDESTIRAALSLAQIYVDSGEPGKALDLMNRDNFGALKLVEDESPWATKIAALPVEAYKTAIRAHVASAGGSVDTAAAIESAQDMLDALRERLKDEPNGKNKMISIYISLAKDLERQLKIAPAPDRRVLSKGFESFLRGAAEGNKDIAVQNWVGATFFSLGQGMLQGTKTTPEAQRYFTESASAYEQVLTMAKAQPDSLSPDALTQVRARQAMAYRQLGRYSQAIDLFAKVLGGQKKSYLNIQIEAAKTFQQWGDSGKADGYSKAILGGKPGANGKNVIWGWGRLAKLIAKNEKYRSTFHEARYNIALSRYRLAMKSSGKKQKDLLGRAKSDITMTEQLYKLGAPKQEQRYRKLLLTIEKSMGG